MKAMRFRGWAVAVPINGRLYTQIETVRYTRREAIAAAVKCNNMTDDAGKMRLLGDGKPDKSWADLRREGAVATKVVLEQRSG